LVFGVGIVVVVYVVPAVEKKTQSKSGKKTKKTRKKKTRKKVSAEKSNASGLSLTCNHAEARKKCFAVLIRTRRFSLSCFSFLFSSLFLLSSFSLSPFSLLLFPRQKESSKKSYCYIKYISLSPIHPSFHPSSSSSTHRVHSHYYLLLLDITD